MVLLIVLDLFEPVNWHGHPARDSESHPVGDSERRRRPARDSLAGTSDNQTASVREGLFDTFLNILAMTVSVSLRLIHHGRLLPSSEARAAWAKHEAHDIYPTMKEVRALFADILPDAKIRKHLLWRYSIIWKK